jgi:branched-chain amino acid transport system permease protein
LRRGRAALAAVPLACLAAAPLVARVTDNAYILSLGTRAAIYALAAVSLQTVVGYAGLVSLGYAGFVGIGAYALLILGSLGLDDAVLSLPAASAAAALFAWPTGWIALRARGVGFLMLTLAFSQMAYFAAGSLADYGGDDGMPLGRTPPLLGSGVLDRPAALYALALLLLLLGLLGARRLGASRFGRVLRSARENASRVAALGFDVDRTRLIAYVLAGSVGGIAGWLLAASSGFVSPALLDWRVGGELLVMVILGGAATPEGAMAGAVGLVLAEEGLAAATQHGRAALGALLVLAALIRLRRCGA